MLDEMHEEYEVELSQNNDFGDPLQEVVENPEILSTPCLTSEQEVLLERFSDFLLQQHSQEELDDELSLHVDLFSLFHEMAQIKNEVKLESRQIKKTLDDYKEIIGLLKSSNELLSQQLSQQNELYLKTKNQHRREYALELIKFCDYLNISLDNLRQSHQKSWFSKWSKKAKWINSAIEGQHLLVSRFNSLLKNLDVKPMLVVNHPFDPELMCVAEVRKAPSLANGLVIAELKTGYFMGNTVLRTADVVVNKLENKSE